MDTRTDQSTSAQMHALANHHQQCTSANAGSSGTSGGSGQSAVGSSNSNSSQRDRRSSSSNGSIGAGTATAEHAPSGSSTRPSPLSLHEGGSAESNCRQGTPVDSANGMSASFVAAGSSQSPLIAASAEPRLLHQFTHHPPRSLHHHHRLADIDGENSSGGRSPRVRTPSISTSNSPILVRTQQMEEEGTCPSNSSIGGSRAGITNASSETSHPRQSSLLPHDRSRKRKKAEKDVEGVSQTRRELVCSSTHQPGAQSCDSSMASVHASSHSRLSNASVTADSSKRSNINVGLMVAGVDHEVGEGLREARLSPTRECGHGNVMPLLSSYSMVSTVSSQVIHPQDKERDALQSSPKSFTVSFPDTQEVVHSHFVSPNIRLHRRVFSNSSSNRLALTRLRRRKKAYPYNVGDCLTAKLAATAATAEELHTVVELRRSSLGTTTSSNVEPVIAPVPAADAFQLQPVPAYKRKRSSVKFKGKTVEAGEASLEKRRKRGAVQMTCSQPVLASLKSVADAPQTADIIRTQETASSTGLSLSRPVSSGTTSIHSDLAKARISPSKPGTSSIARPKLSRSQSLPLLKAKPVLDITQPAVHRLTLPPRLVEYLALMRDNAQRQHSQIRQDNSNSRTFAPRDRMPGQTASTPVSAFARNGYCSTTIDAQGNVKSIFVPSLHPPITRQTLKELDLHEILKNPQLRHDIVFDSNVQFRPNFDGERGRKKKEFGNKYWFAIQKEIESGCTCTSFSGRVLLPCACGLDNGKTAVGRFAHTSLSSVKSPLPSLANYSHSAAQASRLASPPGTSTTTPNNGMTPRSAGGLRGGRIPSRIPLLIQELRAICLSVLPSPSVNADSSSAMHSAAHKLNPPPNGYMGPATSKQTMQPLASPAASRLAAAATAAVTPGWSATSVASHHFLIAQALDPHLITQQLQHGVLDIATLVTFLGSILKLHCAPMRDDLIEKMIKTVCEDGEVALGLRLCFEILELMKLDIANHQLRSSRMYLIETAVDFEIRWFREQLDHRKVTLDRTSHWFGASFFQQKADAGASTTTTRTEMISKAFDHGLMYLIFEQPLVTSNDRSIAGVGSSNSLAGHGESAPFPVGTTVSSASLNHAYTHNFPETFQFDAYRLMSFHGDVTDIIVVYMLLLLFRQLACSTSNLSETPLPVTTLSSAAVLENASTIASRQLAAMKSEIWTLLNDADLEIAGPGVASASMPRTPSTPSLTGRLLSQGIFTGSQKLENPIWRKAMNDVVLQIAARAIDVQIQARKEVRRQTSSPIPPSPSSSPSHSSPPSGETVKLLMSWMETNLRRGSSIHALCQQRLQNVLYTIVNESTTKTRTTRLTRKVPEEAAEDDVEGDEQDTPKKRIRLQDGSSPSTSISGEAAVILPHKPDNVHRAPVLSTTDESELEQAIRKGGLEPFAAEIKLLSERILKVKTFHLRVFRSLYEKMAVDADTAV